MTKQALRVVETEERGLGTPLPVKISRIEPLDGQPRRWFDPDALNELADDIQANGQQQPVRLAKLANKSGIFVLIGGERRWRAMRIIQERTGVEPTINAFIEVVENQKALYKAAFLDNLRREDLIPLDEAAAYHRLRTEDNMTIGDIATLVGKSASHVDGYLRMHTLPDEVKKLMNPALPKDQQLSVTSSIDIARATSDPSLRLSIAEESIERELSVAETRALIAIKGGEVGKSYGGRLRKPSDDYKVWTAFIGRIQGASARFHRDVHFPSLYSSRPDEARDRERDALKLQEAIATLQTLLSSVRGRK